MPRAGLTPERVVDEAALIADEVGLERLTLSEVAARLGVAVPSLYKHVVGLDALRARLAVRSVDALASRLSAAATGRAGADALRAVADTYRAFAHEHPGLYAAAQRAPDRADPSHVAAGDRAVEVIFAVLRGYGLAAAAEVDAARTLRSALHGFVTLEQAGGFGLEREVDRSFAQMVAALDLALRRWPGDAGES